MRAWERVARGEGRHVTQMVSSVWSMFPALYRPAGGASNATEVTCCAVSLAVLAQIHGCAHFPMYQ